MYYLAVWVFLVFVVNFTSSHPLQKNYGIEDEEDPYHLIYECLNHNHDTLCKISPGNYGCCPMVNAICCSDKKHCCPEGFTCSTEKNYCINNLEKFNLTLIQKEPLDVQSKRIPDNVPSLDLIQTVICPDRKSQCADGQTCCVLYGHTGFGCCNGLNAVCCNDSRHCCPEGYECYSSSNGVSCRKKDSNKPLLKIHVDISSYCSESNAVYCGDMTHCCPSGTKCDLIQGLCIQDGLSFPMLTLTDTSTKVIICPDGTTECPNGNTCCPLPTGSFGCCPQPEAACCDDKVHCCPHGYTCDPYSNYCDNDKHSIPVLKKMPALPYPSPMKQKTVCPDNGTVCGLDQTCCELSDGKSWGCCPTPNGVCCSGGSHCCPENYRCDMNDLTCKPLIDFSIITSLELNKSSSFIACPDKSHCGVDQTCCGLGDGSYGCCRAKNGVCCSDKLHCCPKDFKCENNGKCIKVAHAITYMDLL